VYAVDFKGGGTHQFATCKLEVYWKRLVQAAGVASSHQAVLLTWSYANASSDLRIRARGYHKVGAACMGRCRLSITSEVSCVAAMDDPGRSPDFNGIRPQRSTWQVCLAGQVTAAPVIQLLIHVCNAMAL
jgi:hypothetical protein